MANGSKVIHDSVHGSVKVDSVFLDILERPEMQRLHGVHQLGLAYYVFPGANHTRLEHSLGAYHVANMMAGSLGLDKDDRRTVLAAALLHDLGHPPFSHTLEEIIWDQCGKDHMDISRSLILGECRGYDAREAEILGDIGTIADLLERNEIDPDTICRLICSSDQWSDPRQGKLSVEGGQAHFGQLNYLHQMISGPLDVDQMDYLLRDAYYTGVAHGTIDIDRLLQTVCIFHGDLVINKNGLVAAEGLLVARSLMYTSVYFHKTVRIAEMMLCKAVELSDPSIMENIHAETDCALMAKLKKQGGEPARLMAMLHYRKLYKKALMIPVMNLDDSQIQQLIVLADYKKRRIKEAEIADKAGLPSSQVILDIPEKALLLSEPIIGKTEVPVLDGDHVRSLSKYSPLAKAIQTRGVHDWAVLVSTPPDHKDEVERAAMKALFS